MKKTYEVIVSLNGDMSEEKAHWLLFDADDMPDLITDLACWLVELGDVDQLDISIRLREQNK